jgi:hypothetical protein
MTYVMFAALSAVAALLFGPVYGFVNTKATAIQNTSVRNFLGSYAGRTAVLTAAFFVVIIGAASVMSLLAGKKAADIPTIG